MITTPNYWLFQGKPEAYDFAAAVKENLIEEWNVKAHWKIIKKGDKAILWLSGENSGCYALADIIDNPRRSGKSVDHNLWNVKDDTGRKHKIEDEDALKVRINITHNRFKNPILWREVKTLKGLEYVKAGYRGTNFKSTKEEYQIFKGLMESSNNQQ
jgi:predicted RNA-binding protein with PUA-like domain